MASLAKTCSSQIFTRFSLLLRLLSDQYAESATCDGTNLALWLGMNSPSRKLVLLASLLFATACSGGTGDNESGIRTLSNGETLPAECDICWVDFEACAESGVDIELCEQAIVTCAEICDAPLPPNECDHCFAGYEACVDQAVEGMQDVGDCVAGLESCLSSCELPNPCLPGDEGCWCGPDTPDGDLLPGGDCPPTPCEDICISQCYFDVEPQDGEIGDAPPIDSCFEECMMECEPIVEPCYELCWTCDSMDEDCEPGCEWVCEPKPEPCYEVCWDCPQGAEDCVPGCETICEPEPCYEVCPTCPEGADCDDMECEFICEPEPCTGTCEQVCDPAGNCETVCWDDCDSGTEPPEPEPAD